MSTPATVGPALSDRKRAALRALEALSDEEFVVSFLEGCIAILADTPYGTRDISLTMHQGFLAKADFQPPLPPKPPKKILAVRGKRKI